MWNNIIKNLPEAPDKDKVNKQQASMPTLTESDKRIKCYVIDAYSSPIDRIIKMKILKGVI